MELVPELIPLAALLFALAFIVVARRAIQAFLGTLASWLSFVPGIGGVTASLVNSAEAAISGALSSAIAGIESAIGRTWHLLARQLDDVWHANVTVAENLWHLAKQFYSFANTNDVTKWVNELTHKLNGVERVVRTEVRREVRNITKVVEKTVTETVPHIRAIERAIAHTIPREIGSLWGATKALEDSIGRLWDRVRSLPTSVDVAAAIAAAIAAIDLFKLNPFRCSEASNLFNRGCSGVWGGLEDLLGMLVDLFVITNLCDVIPALETAFSDVAAPAIGELTSAIDSMPCVAGNQPPTLAVPALALPPSPDLTLSLP